ncbi:hypothetical protein FHX73_11613 [Kitasatospora viridis]|uniref:Uncharacterized protein n=2 Tax=Kitasatospora viridis TaxID=281105 RepID=A0A561UBV8_9ACTN|nr:hypothetical protein FHX73_11613 [Kitasatospora viridis]
MGAMTSTDLNHPDTVRAFGTVRKLVIAYFGLSVLTLAAILLLRNHHSQVNPTVWSRGIAVVFSAAVTFWLTNRAAGGSRNAFRRLRFVSVVFPLAIVYIVTAQAALPLWMKIEQGACGLVLVGVAAVVNGRHLRELFAAR